MVAWRCVIRHCDLPCVSMHPPPPEVEEAALDSNAAFGLPFFFRNSFHDPFFILYTLQEQKFDRAEMGPVTALQPCVDAPRLGLLNLIALPAL